MFNMNKLHTEYIKEMVIGDKEKAELLEIILKEESRDKKRSFRNGVLLGVALSVTTVLGLFVFGVL